MMLQCHLVLGAETTKLIKQRQLVFLRVDILDARCLGLVRIAVLVLDHSLLYVFLVQMTRHMRKDSSKRRKKIGNLNLDLLLV